MLFHFKAQKLDGSVYEEDREATDKFALYRDVKKEGGIIISADEIESKSLKKYFEKIDELLGSIKIHDKIIFARNLGSMLHAGLSLSRSLSVIERQSRNKKLKKVILDVLENVSKGETLHNSLDKHPKVFPPLFSSMVKAGEESGSLPETLSTVASQMDKIYSLQKKVRGALIYPIIIVILMIIIGIIMLVYIVPNLTSTFTELGVELPLSTRIIIGISDILRYQFLWFIGAVVLIVIGAVSFMRTRSGRRFFDYFFLKIPIIGQLVKEVNTARTARTLSSLLSAGVDMLIALTIVGEVVQNSFYREVVEDAKENVERGATLSSVFAENEELYPPFVGEMASVGEETGKLSDMFLEVAVFYEDVVDQKTKNFSTIIEPFIMVFIGVGVGFFAIAMISPTLSLVNAL
ncbi:MAG: hypothetical protein COV70_02430 [Parcubacteria group bacterium CG11_big_fil_rev_8_21_14_0_20_39_22]|nr:MAG: hypothetical protein COV70_02430 [Parcubacteria group bacterium CG11_big_fil_rev_8_21_14_0_20_39_22]